MGYFNIIDSLKDVEVVNEDMKSMTKDKKNKDVEELVKALLKFDIDLIPSNKVSSYKKFYNRTAFGRGFSKNVGKFTPLRCKNSSGGEFFIACVNDGLSRFLMIYEKRRGSYLGRCFIFKAPDESTRESLYEIAYEGKMTFDVNNPKLDGCKLVTDTYCVHHDDRLLPSNRISDDTYLLNDTDSVMDKMFNILSKDFKGDIKGGKYDSVVEEIASLCKDYEISLTDKAFEIIFEFGGARDCNKVEKLLRSVRIGYCYFYKEGKSKIRFGCRSLSRY